MPQDLAIKIIKLSKSFRIPTEKTRSVRERFVNLKWRINSRNLDVLKNINLEVKKGEWLGIIGVNGSGKSSLLKLINNIYEPDEGTIEVSGRLVPFLELGVGFNPELSAADNIFLNGTILGITRKQIRAKFKEIVKFAGIGKFINLKLKNFSSGMNVRLGFSVAMQSSGDIFLLDEILAVGDYQFQQKTKRVFKRLKRLGRTVIFVSHDLLSIKRNCDRVIWLNRGRIMAEGDPETVVNRYTHAKA